MATSLTGTRNIAYLLVAFTGFISIFYMFFFPSHNKITPEFVIALGDSITQQGSDPESNGWLTQLQYKYNRKLDILNRGYSGYNSRLVLKHALQDIPPSSNIKAKLVTIFLGANDAVYDQHQQYVSLDEYKSNLQQLVTYFLNRDYDSLILVITPPPIEVDALTKRNLIRHKPLDRSNERTGLYAQAALQIASNNYDHYNNRVIGVDLFSALGGGGGGGGTTTGDTGKYLSDGLHLNKEGNNELYKLIQTTLDKTRVASDQLNFRTPAWIDLINEK